MSAHEKRKIIELITRYKLEPSIRDLYVEGEIDKGLLDWYLNTNKRRSVAVYEISTVEVPVEEIAKLGLYDNNRGRVMALSHLLSPHLPSGSSQVTCIADKDLDMILGIERQGELLLFTDYTCIEMYLYNSHTLRKFLELAVRNFPNSADEILAILTPVLESLFLARLANEALRLCLHSIRFERYCSVSSSGITFNLNEYIRNYLTSNGRPQKVEVFLQEMERQRLHLTSDARLQIHGHDFTRLLSWYIGKRRPALRQILSQETIERALLLSLEREQLYSEGFFRTLHARLGI